MNGGDILVETIGKVEQLVTRAQRAQLIACPAMPKDKVLIEKTPGNVEGFDVPRAAVVDKASTLAGLAQQINAIDDDSTDAVASVYVGNDAISVVWDDNRRDRITMMLPWSEPFTVLARPDGLAGCKQRDLVWLLRSTFRGMFSPPELLPALRNVKFTNAGESDTNLQHGRESLGRKVEAEVAGAGAIPEEVLFSVPVFSDVSFEGNQFVASVLCALNIDLAEQRFTLKPVPDAIAVAKRLANEWICGILRHLCPTARVFEASAAG